MKVTLQPTRERYDAPINGGVVPVRIWSGTTEGGVAIEAYVLALTPDNEEDVEKFKAELPDFMRPSRESFTIDTAPQPFSDAELANLEKHPTFWSQDGFRWYQDKKPSELCVRAAAEIRRLRAELAAKP